MRRVLPGRIFNEVDVFSALKVLLREFAGGISVGVLVVVFLPHWRSKMLSILETVQ